MKTFSKEHGVYFYIIIAFCVVLFSLKASADEKEMQKNSNEELVTKLLQLTYNCQFKEAQALVDKVLKEDSMSIEWNYYDGMILWRSMVAKEEYEEGRGRFLGIMERVVKIGGDRLTSNPLDTVALLCTGGAYGFIGMYYAHDHSYFKATSIGKKGIDLHEKLITISPNYYDAYLSLGLYHAMASNVPWFIKPLLYIFGKSGDEEKAIEYLSMASLKGRLSVYEAKWALYNLFIRRKNHEQALNNIQSLATQFPNNYLYAIRAVELLRYMGQRSEMIDIGKRIWEGYKTSVNTLTAKDSIYIGLICYYLGEAYSRQGESRKAIEIFEESIKRKIFVYFLDDTFLLLGNNYEKEHQNENAVNCYRKVIEVSQSSDLRKKAQERLEILTKN